MRNVSAAKAVKFSLGHMGARLRKGYLAGMLALVLLRLAALAPLLTLFLAPEKSNVKFLAFLTPALYIFLIFPLRYSMGEVMSRALDGGEFSIPGLFSLKDYGKKMGAVLMQGLHLLPWALPLAAGLAGGFYLAYGVKDGTDVFRMVNSMGKIWGAGHGFKEGIYMVLCFAGLLALVLLYGMMRNGMLRYVWAGAGGNYRAARREMRRRLKGRRGGQLAIGLLQALLLLPALLPALYMGYRLLRQFMMYLKLDLFQLYEPQMLWGILAAFFLVYWPLLPLRRVMQASYIHLSGDGQ